MANFFLWKINNERGGYQKAGPEILPISMTHAPKSHSVHDTSTCATLHKPVAYFLLREEIRCFRRETEDQILRHVWQDLRRMVLAEIYRESRRTAACLLAPLSAACFVSQRRCTAVCWKHQPWTGVPVLRLLCSGILRARAPFWMEKMTSFLC